MPSRTTAPTGSPCWADLWTPDVEGSRRFYAELFGWEAQDPSPEFGGYFMFTQNGVPVAGGMGDMGAIPADNTWKIYLESDDIGTTLERATAAGAEVLAPAIPVADLGVQAVLRDAVGATVGVWQPGTFPGFTVLGEPGAPSWFELHTSDHSKAVSFYHDVFGLATNAMSDTDEFRYTTLSDAAGGAELAGIMDARTWLPDGAPSYWTIYWEVEDAAASTARVGALGGSVVAEVQQTPYGQISTVADPAGAQFRLRTG